MTKPLRLQARDYEILMALLSYTALPLAMIEKFLFLEPGKTRSRCWVRLDKLRHHSLITRKEVEKDLTVFLLTEKGRDLITQKRNIDPNTFWVDPERIKSVITHWDHHLTNCELHMMIVKAVDCLNSLYILDHSKLPSEIREAAKVYIRRGWSRNRIFTRLNHLLYLQQSQPVENPAEWLAQAIETNSAKPKGFSAKTFRSPLDNMDISTEGYQILDWKNDIALSRLKADQRLWVEYTPLNGKGTRSGQVEADHELTIAFFNRGNSKSSRSYTLMLEYDSGSRPLELSTAAPNDKADNSFSTQIKKKVVMLEAKTYQRVRGQNLDRIGIVCSGDKALSNRITQVEACGGKQKFMLASLKMLRSLKNPCQIITAPVFKRCGNTSEQYYPLIGSSNLDRYLQETRRTTKSEEVVSELREEIYEAARRELYISILSELELDQAQMQQLSKESKKGNMAANIWLSRWYSQRYGPTYLKSLAIFADLEAERRMEEMK